MKTLLFLFASVFLISYFQLTRSENKKAISINSTSGFEKIISEIKRQNATLKPMDKLNLALIDYMFKYPEKYKKVQTVPDGFLKIALSKDEDFIALCKKRQVSIEDMDDRAILLNDTVKNQHPIVYALEQGLIKKEDIIKHLNKKTK